ncbi:integrase [Desulfobacter hydrogenophilus]|uniref:Integrase n=1 Tax=Desulfobacter hydrogenophilus TaxID=2291 RepID=A0A328FK25_9BACT|nr:integrase [Desulfobacter hydrogenophilus]NDY74614.1 integrase [Desulfobacter hydrogenophilus]QBH11761.1 integrase [Desulfobacter hydrogenophilus]QBH13164.1 integrase [Desulfobacter hydrogenophilus]QBH13358.1 integrase [Desulfobacter hydrogenophilus]QBH13585.1 integrase [Desulfobacter hydrogenophilus]
MDDLTIDDRFHLLLHKKIMNKTGSTKRRSKKYYKDQYKKTGIIPAPLLLVEKGIMEGRKCSGRPRAIDEQTKRRFIEMVKASCDPSSQGFIFITRKARTIKNYHHWLEQELGRTISLPALRRCVKRENLKFYLEKEDKQDQVPVMHAFKSVPVFALIQVDGCKFQYLRIRDEHGNWQKPQVIEIFDTASRKMFILDFYFTESSLNSVDLFTRFLLSTPLPLQKIGIRPDQAKGFLNLKRPINAINLKHSTPQGFYLAPDFSKAYSPKDKAHLESSHRSLHNFEIRIIKAFEDRIVKTVTEYDFKRGRKEKITVTLLDISLQELRSSTMLSEYRNEHNHTQHYFTEDGVVSAWVPAQKFDDFLSNQADTLNFTPDQVQEYMKYGYRKIKATVSKTRTIRHDKRDYYVTRGADKFSKHKSTPVKISKYKDKLFIFEQGEDGILLGEAIAKKPFDRPPAPEPSPVPPDELDTIIALLEKHNMAVDRPVLVDVFHKGLTLARAEQVLDHNQSRYADYTKKINQPDDRKNQALFNAFMLDCQKSLNTNHVAIYASHGDIT